MKILGVEFAPLRVPFERRMQTLGVMNFVYSFLFLGFGSLFLIAYLLVFTQYYYLVLLYGVWYYWDRKTPSRGGRPVQWVRNWKLWKRFIAYFPMELVKTADLDRQKNYILGCHPHGVLSASVFGNFATEGSHFSEKFPGMRPSMVILPGHFQFPLYREYIMCAGATESSKESMTYMLTENGKGNALALVPGGALEALDCHPGRTTLKMKERKGFIKIALRTGTSLVPVYSFGENELYVQAMNDEGTVVRRFQNFLTKYLGFSPPLFHGRGIFNYSLGLLPYRRPVHTVVGKPIDVVMTKTPSQEDIDKLHEMYLSELTTLFETHKEKYGVDKETHLNIVP